MAVQAVTMKRVTAKAVKVEMAKAETVMTNSLTISWDNSPAIFHAAFIWPLRPFRRSLATVRRHHE